MVVTVAGPAQLDTHILSCWHATDERFGGLPVIVFIGPSTTTNVTQNSSRIQAHVFSEAGFQSFPRLTINPGSALYTAVNKLPAEQQGNETRRGLATSLFKYFDEMPKAVKDLIRGRSDHLKGHTGSLLDDAHAASLAAAMTPANAAEVFSQIAAGLTEMSLSWLDVEVVIPPEAVTLIAPLQPDGRASLAPLPDSRSSVEYGKYAALVECFGDPTFLPTSRIRRAPSKPTAVSRARVLDSKMEEGLRREIQELVSTEERYVSKLQDLVDSIAVAYYRGTSGKPTHLLASGDKMIQKLFPPSLEQILALNREFSQAIGVIAKSDYGKGTVTRDPTGALKFSKIMLEYFPRFRGPYQDYLRASSEFPQIMAEVVQDKTTPWAQAVYATGEQRLRSWLIEPVQRLPRYNLFIDNMANLLPAAHPAMSRFLLAKDTITDICALESDEPMDNLRVIQRLQKIVQGWPDQLRPLGRLISAVDCNELEAPFEPDPHGRRGKSNVLLLFPDYLLVLGKLGNLSARGLLAEVDRPAAPPPVINPADAGSVTSHFMRFLYAVPLFRTRFTECHLGRVLTVISHASTRMPTPVPDLDNEILLNHYQLLAAYEGKTARFVEEISMAKIEGRFPESIREDERWGLRTSAPGHEELGILAAIFPVDKLAELGSQDIDHGRTRVIIDNCVHQSCGHLEPEISLGVATTVYISLLSDGRFRLEVINQGRQISADKVTEQDFPAILAKRLGYVQRLSSRPCQPDTVMQHIQRARAIARSIQLLLEVDEATTNEDMTPAPTESRRFRPISPVKGLSSLLSGVSQPASPVKQLPNRGRTNSTKSSAVLPSLVPSQLSRPMSYIEPTQVAGPALEQSAMRQEDVSTQLENAFATYIDALRSRRGNIVGRTLQNRAQADILAVNELYNILLEDPSQYQAVAEVSVDVLFAAFEKFLKHAWREKLGPLITSQTLRDMHNLLFSGVPGISQQFKLILNEMSPQNQRALTAMIAVLAELVNGTSNDGDRGVLVLTFSELLTDGGSAGDQLLLFDRLLADSDMLFGVEPPGPTPDTADRSRVTNTGSVGSTASSIGKKLGFLSGLSRGNSKSGDSESRIAQVLRQLSKRSNAETDSTPPSISRSLLSRTRSTDSRPTTPGSSVSRPGSSYSGQGQDKEWSRPGSAHGLVPALASINEGRMKPPVIPPSKKRRSSLSDLNELKRENSNASESTTAANRRNAASSSVAIAAVEPQAGRQTPSLRKHPTDMSVMNRGRPTVPIEYATPSQSNPVLQERDLNQPGADTETRGSHPAKSPTPTSGAPVARQDLSQRLPVITALSPTKPNKAPPSPQKLRMQSPQKLRERLELEKRAMEGAGPGLQAELAKIGQELAVVNLDSQNPRATLAGLSQSVNSMGKMLRTRLDELGRQTDSIQADLESSLAVSEKKAKSLDELYRESNAENELLYDRFNSELSKILKGIRAGDGVEEMRRKLQEAHDESARLRKENQRLKRENLGLRSQLRNA